MPYCLDNKADFIEFWNRVIELRELPVSPKQKLAPFRVETWESLIAPIYDIQLQVDPTKPIRSSELMYRTWDRMEGSAPKQAFQGEFAELCKTSKVARSIIEQEDGTSQFIQLADPNDPRDEWDTSVFNMGASESDENATTLEKPQYRVRVEPFAMHRFCTTNQQFELYDPNHDEWRAFRMKLGHASCHHPAVYLTWYDNWCFTKWIGAIRIDTRRYGLSIPAQSQWEYACRCGETTPYTLSDRRFGQQIQYGDANFMTTQKRETDSAEARRSRGCTIPVNGRDDNENVVVPPNPWGLYQMHGNVWEWTLDWYSDQNLPSNLETANKGFGFAKIVRGGSCLDQETRLRSTSRTAFSPETRGRTVGMRLVAMPLSQDESEPNREQ